MKANDLDSPKQTVFDNSWTHKASRTQTGSPQNDSPEKLKIEKNINFYQNTNLVRSQKTHNGAEKKDIYQKGLGIEVLNSPNQKQKKQNQSSMQLDQQFIGQYRIVCWGNGENINSQGHGNLNDRRQLNVCSLNRITNQIYNNLKPREKHGFQQNKKTTNKNYKNKHIQLSQISPQNYTKSLTSEHPFMFLQSSDVIHPIPTHILQLNDLTKNQKYICQTIKPHHLPMGFCYLLQMLNISYLFPQSFIFDKETIDKIAQTLQTPLQSLQNQLNTLLQQNFNKYMNLLTTLIFEDLNSQRLSTIADKRAYNILSLAKFCQENQLMQFVFKYNWPTILLQLATLSSDEAKGDNNKFQKSINYMRSNILNQNYTIPDKFDLRFEFISLLIDSYSKTNSFREYFNKKIESNRNMNKRKGELEQQKQKLQQNIKNLQNNKQKKTKRIVKKEKKKSIKFKEESEELSSKQRNANQNEAVEKLQRGLEQVQQQILKQNRQDSLSCCHYLGTDQHGFMYWYVSYFPDKLFVEKADSSWFYFQLEQINHLLECLDRKRINEEKLLQRVQQYYQSSINKHLSKMQIETEQNNGHARPANHMKLCPTVQQKSISNFCSNLQIKLQHLVEHEHSNQHESSKNSSENHDLLTPLGTFKIDQNSLFRMIELGEIKMTEYLKDRNSRWGTEENKQLLLSTIKECGPNRLQEAKKKIALFNQKICVVEIQYKVFVQQSAQQVDSKIKKIQTKIWGINEKYKHNWYDFIHSCNSFSELFFAVSVLYSLIKKYTSKHRKLRKEYEEIKQKTVWKTTIANKQWRQTWNEFCEVCGNSGQVLCCDFCPKVYHLDCININVIPDVQFKCKSCKQQITTRNQLKSISHEARNKNKK